MVDYNNPKLREPAKIRWFGYQRGDNGSMERTPRLKGVTGYPGFDATCTTCGWDSRIGQGLEAAVKRAVEDHKWDHEWAVRSNNTPEQNDALDAQQSAERQKRYEARTARRDAKFEAKYGPAPTSNPNLGPQF